MKKKFLVIILSILLVCSLVFFVGCSNSNSNNTSAVVDDPGSDNSDIANDPTDSKVEEPTQDDDIKAEPVYKDGLKYTLDSKTNTYTVTCDDTTLTKVSILDSIDGVKVTSIADEAFKGCQALTSVEIPSTVSCFSASAFKGCTALSTIDIDEDNETYIVEDGCIIDIVNNSLVLATSSAKIPDNIEKINKGAYNFPDATELIVPNSVKEIEMGAFSGCGSLEKINLPFIGETAGANNTSHGVLGYVFGTEQYKNSITQNYSQGQGIRFYIPKGLKEITISGGDIGFGAFYNCSEVTKIVLGKDVTSVGIGITDGCEKLQTITVESGNAIYSAVGNCLINNNTKSIIAGCNNSTIPTDSNVTNIAERAFISCENITSLSIPANITVIGQYAFADCSGITTLSTGSNVTRIYQNAFRGCTSLRSVTFGSALKTIGDDSFAYCTSLTAITIGPNVEAIESFAFEGCTSLTSATIASSVKGIGRYIFYGCDSLQSVTVQGTITFKKNTGYDGSGTMQTATVDFSNAANNVALLNQDIVWTRA